MESTIIILATAIVIILIVFFSLRKIEKTVSDNQKEMAKEQDERFEMMFSSFYESLGEMRAIAGQVGDVKKVLSGVKTRGILGEVQLGAILEEILTPDQYDTEVATIPGASERVEFAVKMPGQGIDTPVWLPIDSKFPGDSYARLVDAYEAGDKAMIEEAKKNLQRVMRNEAKDIKSKYVMPPYTTDFGIMFLPFEGLYAEAIRMGMVEVLQREFKISIAGPTTMAALLNSLQMGFRTLAIEKHAGQVWEVLGAVKNEFGKYEEVLNQTRKRLKQADDELEELVGARTRAIERKLRDIEKGN